MDYLHTQTCERELDITASLEKARPCSDFIRIQPGTPRRRETARETRRIFD